jgi:hypothetical protein
MKIRVLIPEGIKRHIRPFWRLFKKCTGGFCANIIEPTGKLSLDGARYTFVVAVGPSFDQNRPDAMMTCAMGYCHAFEELGIPFLLVDVNDLRKMLPALTNPFCMIFGADYAIMSHRIIHFLKKYPKFVWVDPWFKGSDEFFKFHGLDARIWTWSNEHRRRILDSEPSFVYTATVEPGLEFFREWERRGVRLLSLPLACDTTLYDHLAPYRKEFEGIRMVFVGGYWKSKARQIDKYLRTFEDDLVLYGYSKWPYRGYRGQLSREAEPSLYQQALVSPAINEPTVKLLHGQINERVFKVLGSGGTTVVDAIPAYRQLFTEEELIVPKDEFEFEDIVRELFTNGTLREKYSSLGREAVLSRHTYIHRARVILRQLDVDAVQSD